MGFWFWAFGFGLLVSSFWFQVSGFWFLVSGKNQKPKTKNLRIKNALAKFFVTARESETSCAATAIFKDRNFLMDYTTAWHDEILMARADAESAEAFVCAEKSDAQLVELVLAGDEAAFENLFERYKRLVGSIGARYFRRPEQIEEIVQISFTKIYLELGNFRGAHDFSMASWIGRIATNACLDVLRSQKRKPEDLQCELSDEEHEFLFADAGGCGENALVQRDLAEKLLSHLAADDRAVLQMLDAEEMSVGEVAEATGWSKSKVKIRAFRARHALRKILRKFL
jgi:RNA polymerase sigma-70 factor, ECF subfamily